MTSQFPLRTVLLLSVFSSVVLCTLGCSDAASVADTAPPGDPESAETTGSELSVARSLGVVGTDGTGYAASAPNVARELAASLDPRLVTNGVAHVPGVVRAASSTSPYAYAATVELGAWSSISTTSFDLASGSSLYVWVGGSPTNDVRGFKAAKALFDALTNATQTSENDAIVRRSSRGSVVCARYTASYRCVLGPFSNVTRGN